MRELNKDPDYNADVDLQDLTDRSRELIAQCKEWSVQYQRTAARKFMLNRQRSLAELEAARRPYLVSADILGVTLAEQCGYQYAVDLADQVRSHLANSGWEANKFLKLWRTPTGSQDAQIRQLMEIRSTLSIIHVLRDLCKHSTLEISVCEKTAKYLEKRLKVSPPVQRFSSTKMNDLLNNDYWRLQHYLHDKYPQQTPPPSPYLSHGRWYQPQTLHGPREPGDGLLVRHWIAKCLCNYLGLYDMKREMEERYSSLVANRKKSPAPQKDQERFKRDSAHAIKLLVSRYKWTDFDMERSENVGFDETDMMAAARKLGLDSVDEQLDRADSMGLLPHPPKVNPALTDSTETRPPGFIKIW